MTAVVHESGRMGWISEKDPVKVTVDGVDVTEVFVVELGFPVPMVGVDFIAPSIGVADEPGILIDLDPIAGDPGVSPIGLLAIRGDEILKLRIVAMHELGPEYLLPAMDEGDAFAGEQGRGRADGRLDGTFTAMPKGSEAPYYPWRECGVALFKQGTGTYYVTSNENQFFQGVEVWEGRMLFNNSLDTATATGQHKLSTNNTVTCRPTGTIGGYGTIGGHTALYGTMQPGSDAIGTLSIDGTYALVGYAEKTPTAAVQERKAGSAANLLLYNGASIEFEIINKDKHDEVFVQNQVRLYSDTEGGTDAKINIKLSPRDEWSLAAGDTMVLLQADSLVSFVDGVDLTNYFNLTTEGFDGATFALRSVQIPGEYSVTFNPETGNFDEEQTAAPQYMLVAEVLTAGSGSAEPDAIESVEADNSNLQVYPNPAVDGNVTVAVADGEMAQVAVYNSAAQLVKSVAAAESTLTLDVSDLQAGIYYVRVTTADKAYTQKLVVK